jgi:hypothetical protein
MELFKGSGEWEERAEEQELAQGTPRIDNQKIFNVVEYDKEIKIPKIFFDDQKHGSYEIMVENFARRARTTRDKKAFFPFRAHNSVTTADGVALGSASHLNLNGDTISNLNTSAALSETTLNEAINDLLEMKSQDGELDGFVPRTLLVPPRLFKTACEITKSEYRSGTANNDMNVYSNQYNIQVATSIWLSAAAGGSDTTWFLLADEHSMMRYVRQGIQTVLVDWKFDSKNRYTYKGGFREVVSPMSYEGIIVNTA